MATEKKVPEYKTIKFYGIGWLISLFVCALLLVIKAYSSNPNIWSTGELFIWLTDVFLGVLFFLGMIVLLMIRHVWARFIVGGSFLLFISVIAGLILSGSFNTTQSEAEELIDCYINGIPIKATHANCQQLSIQPTVEPQQVIQQPAQVRVIQQPAPIQIPQIETPTKCTTSENYFTGNLETRCSKSWF
jgi:hypothetical protein